MTIDNFISKEKILGKRMLKILVAGALISGCSDAPIIPFSDIFHTMAFDYELSVTLNMKDVEGELIGDEKKVYILTGDIDTEEERMVLSVLEKRKRDIQIGFQKYMETKQLNMFSNYLFGKGNVNKAAEVIYHSNIRQKGIVKKIAEEIGIEARAYLMGTR